MTKRMLTVIRIFSINSLEKPNSFIFIPTMFFLIYLLLIPALYLLGNLDEVNDLRILGFILENTALAFLIIVILAPIFETLLIQVFFIEIFRKLRFHEVLLILIPGLIFAICHFEWGWKKVIFMIPVGIIFAYAYLRYRKFSFFYSVGVVVLLHVLINICAFAGAYVSAQEQSIEIYSQKLRIASLTGDTRKVLELIQKGAEVNFVNKLGQTPLMLAVGKGNTEIIMTLLKSKAKIDIKDENGNTALSYAVIKRRMDIGKILIDHGANINSKDNDGCTPFLLAVISGNNEAMDFLYKQGADVNAQDNDGWTALMFVVSRNDIKAINKILLMKPKLEIINKNNETALQIAISNKQTEIKDILIKAGSKEYKNMDNIDRFIERYPNELPDEEK